MRKIEAERSDGFDGEDGYSYSNVVVDVAESRGQALEDAVSILFLPMEKQCNATGQGSTDKQPWNS